MPETLENLDRNGYILRKISNSIERTQDGIKHLNKPTTTKGIKVVVKISSHKEKPGPDGFIPNCTKLSRNRSIPS